MTTQTSRLPSLPSSPTSQIPKPLRSPTSPTSPSRPALSTAGSGSGVGAGALSSSLPSALSLPQLSLLPRHKPLGQNQTSLPQPEGQGTISSTTLAGTSASTPNKLKKPQSQPQPQASSHLYGYVSPGSTTSTPNGGGFSAAMGDIGQSPGNTIHSPTPAPTPAAPSSSTTASPSGSNSGSGTGTGIPKFRSLRNMLGLKSSNSSVSNANGSAESKDTLTTPVHKRAFSTSPKPSPPPIQRPHTAPRPSAPAKSPSLSPSRSQSTAANALTSPESKNNFLPFTSRASISVDRPSLVGLGVGVAGTKPIGMVSSTSSLPFLSSSAPKTSSSTFPRPKNDRGSKMSQGQVYPVISIDGASTTASVSTNTTASSTLSGNGNGAGASGALFRRASADISRPDISRRAASSEISRQSSLPLPPGMGTGMGLGVVIGNKEKDLPDKPKSPRLSPTSPPVLSPTSLSLSPLTPNAPHTPHTPNATSSPLSPFLSTPSPLSPFSSGFSQSAGLLDGSGGLTSTPIRKSSNQSHSVHSLHDENQNGREWSSSPPPELAELELGPTGLGGDLSTILEADTSGMSLSKHLPPLESDEENSGSDAGAGGHERDGSGEEVVDLTSPRTINGFPANTNSAPDGIDGKTKARGRRHGIIGGTNLDGVNIDGLRLAPSPSPSPSPSPGGLGTPIALHPPLQPGSARESSNRDGDANPNDPPAVSFSFDLGSLDPDLAALLSPHNVPPITTTSTDIPSPPPPPPLTSPSPSPSPSASSPDEPYTLDTDGSDQGQRPTAHAYAYASLEGGGRGGGQGQVSAQSSPPRRTSRSRPSSLAMSSSSHSHTASVSASASATRHSLDSIIHPRVIATALEEMGGVGGGGGGRVERSRGSRSPVLAEAHRLGNGNGITRSASASSSTNNFVKSRMWRSYSASTTPTASSTTAAESPTYEVQQPSHAQGKKRSIVPRIFTPSRGLGASQSSASSGEKRAGGASTGATTSASASASASPETRASSALGGAGGATENGRQQRNAVPTTRSSIDLPSGGRGERDRERDRERERERRSRKRSSSVSEARLSATFNSTSGSGYQHQKRPAAEWLGPRTAKAFAAAGLLDYERDREATPPSAPRSTAFFHRALSERDFPSSSSAPNVGMARSVAAPSRLGVSSTDLSLSRASSWGRRSSASVSGGTRTMTMAELISARGDNASPAPPVPQIATTSIGGGRGGGSMSPAPLSAATTTTTGTGTTGSSAQRSSAVTGLSALSASTGTGTSATSAFGSSPRLREQQHYLHHHQLQQQHQSHLSSHHQNQHLESMLQTLRDKHSVETEALLGALADSQRTTRVLRDENAVLRERIGDLEDQLADVVQRWRETSVQSPARFGGGGGGRVRPRTPLSAIMTGCGSGGVSAPNSAGPSPKRERRIHSFLPSGDDGGNEPENFNVRPFGRSWHDRNHDQHHEFTPDIDIKVEPDLEDTTHTQFIRDANTTERLSTKRFSSVSSIFPILPSNMSMLMQEDDTQSADHSGLYSTSSSYIPPPIRPRSVSPTLSTARLPYPEQRRGHKTHASVSSVGNVSVTTADFSVADMTGSPGSLHLKPEHERHLGDMISFDLGADDIDVEDL
ncbi:hypothetical protein BD410DRAFT_902903 [Rickenella mellea]|uniref:Uncharacterized protein n=1 Tax=Rickenella mellea TaxID=50990 RepID=A0A4Y7PIA7_9AGAM|nr:hypothetical protein BD410DRAFT_902903 [Rickenella mellea]